MTLPSVHLLTCPRRAQMCRQTLGNWARTDWPGPPRVHVDGGTEDGSAAWGTSGRARRLTEAFAAMLHTALAAPGADDEWFFFLEDDLDFHPHLAALVGSWEALQDSECVLASLFNPSIRRSANFPLTARAFAAEPAAFLGAQALLVRRAVAQSALTAWAGLSGMTSQRLAQLSGEYRPLWIHKPSLVQHVAEDSSWGTRVQKALDFNPAWKP